MKKLILIMFSVLLLVGCTKQTTNDPVESIEPDTETTETTQIPEVKQDIESYAVISELEGEDNLYVRLVFMVDEPYEFVNLKNNTLESQVVSAQSIYFESKLKDTYATNYIGKVVTYNDLIIENQDIEELKNRIINSEYELELGSDKTETIKIEKVYVAEEPMQKPNNTLDLSYTILEYEVKDNRRYYSLPFKLDFVKFSIPNDIDETVYVSTTPGINEDTDNTYFCIYVPFTSEVAIDGPEGFYPTQDQAVECYSVDKGINAGSHYHSSSVSLPTKDYDNGYRVSLTNGPLDNILINEHDLKIYNDLVNKYPLVIFQ